jgi:hypothetical protein
MTTIDGAPDVAQAPDEHSRFTEELRRLADIYDANPGLPLPFKVTVSVTTGDDMRANFAAFARAAGPCDKEVAGGLFSLRATDFEAIEFSAIALREDVCERVVIGVRTVEVVEPDPDVVAALPKVRRMVNEEQVEWRCPDSILRPFPSPLDGEGVAS